MIVNDLPLAVLYGNGDEREQYPLLLNGCSIVVATPPAFLRAIDENTFTNLNRLKHLILDDVDVLLETHPVQLNDILKEINLNLAQRTSPSQRTIQIIACGKQWTDGVERFYVELERFRPIVVVHPWLEASVFAKISTKVTVLKQSEKNKHLLQILKSFGNLTSSIVAICVSNTDSLGEIFKILNKENISVSSRREDSAVDRPFVLCVIDENLISSSIDDVDVLIHYDLGECDQNGKTLFERRWLLMRRHFVNGRRNDSQLRQFIFIAETDAVQSPDVERYLKRLKARVPKKLTQLIAGRISIMHRERERFHLCPYLKCFGACTNKQTCKNRHFLMDLDRRAEFLPSNGEEIFVEIFKIMSAQRFLGRLSSPSPSPTDADIVEIILSSIKPLDDDDFEWSPYVCRWVHQELYERRVRVGVKFALGNTVWAERIVVTEKTNENIWLTRFDLQKSLLERKFASSNEKHLKLLQILINSVKNLSENDVKVERKCSSPTKSTFVFDSLPPAATTTDGMKIEVVVTSVETPNNFYLRKANRTANLVELENELTSKIKTHSLVRVKPSDVAPGLICAANFNGAWQRAVVYGSIGSSSNDVHVFFVDDGDYATCKNDSLYYLPDLFLRKLPALAIPCSLDFPSSSSMDSRAIGNVLWESTRDDETGDGLVVLAEVLGELQTKNTFGWNVSFKIRLRKLNGDDVLSPADDCPTRRSVSNVVFCDEQRETKITETDRNDVDVIGDWKPFFDEKILNEKKIQTVANLTNLTNVDVDENNLRLQNEIISNLVSELIQKVANIFPGLPKLKKIEQKWCSKKKMISFLNFTFYVIFHFSGVFVLQHGFKPMKKYN